MSLMALSPPSISQTPGVFQPPPAILTLELEVMLPSCGRNPPFRQKNLADSPSGPRLNRLENNHRLCHLSGDFWDTIGWPSFIWRENLWSWLDWGDWDALGVENGWYGALEIGSLSFWLLDRFGSLWGLGWGVALLLFNHVFLYLIF